MRKLIAIIYAVLFLGTVTMAGEIGKKAHKHPKTKCFQSASVKYQITDLVAYPTDILNGAEQSVYVSFTVDAQNRIQVSDAVSSNEELNSYVTEKLNGKSLKLNGQECSSGTLKLHFKASSSEGYFIQY